MASASPPLAKRAESGGQWRNATSTSFPYLCVAAMLMAHWLWSLSNGGVVTITSSPTLQTMSSGTSVSNSSTIDSLVTLFQRPPRSSSKSTISSNSTQLAIRSSTAPVMKKESSNQLGRFVKPILLEIGVLLICQAVGLNFLTQLLTSVLAVRRLRFVVPMRNVVKILNPKHVKFVSTAASRLWKSLVAAYSKTSASKIVNRSKKIIKSLIHSHDVDHDENENDNGEHNNKANGHDER